MDAIADLAMLDEQVGCRVGGDYSRHAETDRMTSYSRQAWAANEAQADDREKLSPRDREMVGLYLCIGLYERLQRPGVSYEPDSVDLMIGVLTEIEPQLADDADLHLFIEVMLGFCLTTRGQATGSAADFAAAQPWLLHAIGEVSVGDPERSDLTQILGVGLCVLAGVGAMAGHLDQAIEFLGAAAGQPDEDLDRAAMTHAGLGLMLIQRGGQDQGSRDVGDGIAHLVAAHDLARPGSAVRMMISWNLGSALLTGDPADRDVAVARMTEACRELDDRPGHPQHAIVLTRLARLHHACGEAGP
jgi:hypothetical protein